MSPSQSLEEFVAAHELRLRRALVAAYGFEVGVEATRDALARVCEEWQSVQEMANPAGWAYRAGQSAARRYRRWQRPPPLYPDVGPHMGDRAIEPRIALALDRMGGTRRAAILLVHGYDYPYAEAAELLGVSVSAIRNHVHRGLRALRAELGVSDAT